MNNPTHSRNNSNDDDPFQIPIISFDSPTPTDLTAPAALLHRPGYQRHPTNGTVEDELDVSPPNEEDSVENLHARQGLAIGNLPRSRQSLPRVPVGSKPRDRTASASDLLISPSTPRQDEDQDEEFQKDYIHHGTKPSVSSLHHAYHSIPDTERLAPKTPESPAKGFEHRSPNGYTLCKSNRNIHQGRKHWLSISILILAIYSTALSALWLVVACVKPRYNSRISNFPGAMSPGTASVLSTALAKSIELSYVTVFVAFLGQVLSRRAMILRSKGITIADLSMRNWVMQPGTMITHWESVRFAGSTPLGVITLVATVMAILYTTASDALVSPKLKLGRDEDQLLFGRVATSFANPFYIADHCPTPIQIGNDPEYAASTCIQIEHAGQSYHNYMQYLGTWSENINTGNGSADLRHRPSPVAMLYDNTTVQGSWVGIQNMTILSEQYDRVVLNVSAAYPHSGVFSAARDPINNILQPQDLSGYGEYHIGASVPSPVVNVLCAGVTEEDLAPLVYTQWPNATHYPLNTTTWPAGHGIPAVPSWLNQTAIDDLFGFGEKYGRRPPVFSRFPSAFNTVLNDTASHADALYILATSPTEDYMLCSMSASLTPNCSTHYHASMSGGTMSSRCESPGNSLAYGNRVINATNGLRSMDWVNVATELVRAISLNSGITDGRAANARILTQLIPTTKALDPSLPSIAEALAVLAGCTLLTSSLDAPFIHEWNYSTTVATLKEPQYQAFPATFAYQDYASGGNQAWQNIFYIVLIIVFVMNVLCLLFFIIRGGLVTDFAEPQNLFALSINSPQSQRLYGSCGGGPADDQLKSPWWINVENEHVSIESREVEPMLMPSSTPRSDFEYADSPITKAYSRLSAHKNSIL